jgi:uncharacterized membrane protein YphA (DoxX/SURF4 family)
MLGKALTVLLWIVCLLLVLMFVPAGWAKFFDNSGWARAFTHWGLPVWFRIAIGVVEVAGGVALLVPATRVYAAALLAAVMLGGTATHALHHEALYHEVVPLVLLTASAWLHMRHAKRLSNARTSA